MRLGGVVLSRASPLDTSLEVFLEHAPEAEDLSILFNRCHLPAAFSRLGDRLADLGFLHEVPGSLYRILTARALYPRVIQFIRMGLYGRTLQGYEY